MGFVGVGEVFFVTGLYSVSGLRIMAALSHTSQLHCFPYCSEKNVASSLVPGDFVTVSFREERTPESEDPSLPLLLIISHSPT